MELDARLVGADAQQLARHMIGQDGEDTMLELVNRPDGEQISSRRRFVEVLPQEKWCGGGIYVAAFKLNRKSVFEVHQGNLV